MYKYLKKFKASFISISLILLLGAFLRLYNISDIAQFEYDEQYNSYLVYNFIKNHHLSLVGQEMSFGGMFLGPWHYLYLAPFYMIFSLHPVGGFVGEVFIGVATIVSYFFVGSRLFSKEVGFLAAFFRAILFTLITQDLTITPPYPSELVALWFIYFLKQFLDGSRRAFYILAFLFGLMFTVHLSILPLVAVWIILFVIFKPVKLGAHLLLKSLIFFMLPVLPIILFEIRHNFVHIQRLLTTLVSEGRTEISFLEKVWKVISFNLTNFYLLFDSFLFSKWLGLVVIVAILWVLIKSKKSKMFVLFVTTVCIVILYYIVYPRVVSEYYFMALVPVILLFVSFMLISLLRYSLVLKFCVVFFVLVVTYSNLTRYKETHNYNAKHALSQKDAAVRAIVEHQRGKGEFSVSYYTPYGREFGFQYLFTYYGLEPRKEIKPPIYTIVMPRGYVADKDISVYFQDIGVIFPEDEPEQIK